MTSIKHEPAHRLFNVARVQRSKFEPEIAMVPLDELELAVNPRREVSPEGIDRLAAMLGRGQLVPAIGRRTAPHRVLLYAGQRRLLAARRTHELAGTDGFESITPVACLVVLMLDYEPTEADVRRLQAAENARESLSVGDQQQQFQDATDQRGPATSSRPRSSPPISAHPRTAQDRLDERPFGLRAMVTPITPTASKPESLKRPVAVCGRPAGCAQRVNPTE